MDHPKVSVLVPCFNLGEYLAEAVDSVLEQSFKDFEILVIDDGSTHSRTAKVLEGFVRPNTKLFRTEHRGLAAARNFLVEKARGQYLCALDCDDRLHPDFLARTTALLDADPSLTFVSTHLQMFGTHSEVWPSTDRCDLPMLLAEDTVLTAALVRRSAVLAVGGYDTEMPHQGDEDWDLWIRITEAGYRGLILPDVLFYYRRRPGSMVESCTRDDVHLELLRYLIQKHQSSFKTHFRSVLLAKDQQIGEVRRDILSLESDRARLSSLLGLKRARLEALARRVSGAGGNEERTDPRLQGALDEVAALRSSWSWRLTAPLRRAYDLITGGVRR